MPNEIASPASPNLRGALAWDDLRLVLAVAEKGSLTAASQALGISHPTLSRRLRDAERRLGCRLVDRNPQSCRLTPAGEEARDLAARMAADIAGLERRIAGRDNAPEGPVRLTAPDAVTEYLLSGLLAGLGKALPDVTLDLIVSNQVLSLAQRNADIAVRVTDTPDPGLKGRRIAAVGFAVYGTGDIVSSRATGDRTPWIGFDDGLACSGPGRWLERNSDPSAIRFRANTLPAAAKAAARGVGLALLPCFVGENLPGLVRAGEPVPELDTGLWLLVHPDVAAQPRIRAVRDLLARELRKLAPVIAGRGD
ncbi:MAG: LysR family transcriptional regulator [Rhodospirillales bacterium]